MCSVRSPVNAVKINHLHYILTVDCRLSTDGKTMDLEVCAAIEKHTGVRKVAARGGVRLQARRARVRLPAREPVLIKKGYTPFGKPYALR